MKIWQKIIMVCLSGLFNNIPVTYKTTLKINVYSL